MSICCLLIRKENTKWFVEAWMQVIIKKTLVYHAVYHSWIPGQPMHVCATTLTLFIFTSQRVDAQPWHATQSKQTKGSPLTSTGRMMDVLSSKNLHYSLNSPQGHWLSHCSCFCNGGYLRSLWNTNTDKPVSMLILQIFIIGS